MTTNVPEPGSPLPRPRPSGAIRRRDRMLLIGLAVAVVTFSAISIAVNALRPDVPTTSNSASLDPRVNDSDYVIRLGTTLSAMPQQEAIALGRAACTSLDNGATKATVTSDLTDSGLTPSQAASVIDAAVTAYCPTHR